ncbi:hypothetical protein AK812_SmicGene41393 [Symbiodinium microadriaticum]|uniref:Uncharacterized protein n=1 Tax=Symbiodinium microadriaticum TaxID=2951 RepID=A0A1Q9C6A0_SYMMI|nr:hypothetical protein AK812_SmicGene41393 [Symbiodinium microadriaticum]
MEGFAIPALASAVAFAATSSGLLHPPASVALPFNCLHFRDFTAVGGLAALWLCLRVFLQGDLTHHFLKVSRTLHQPRPDYAGFEKHEMRNSCAVLTPDAHLRLSLVLRMLWTLRAIHVQSPLMGTAHTPGRPPLHDGAAFLLLALLVAMARSQRPIYNSRVLRRRHLLGLPEHPIVDVFAYLCGTAKKVPASRKVGRMVLLALFWVCQPEPQTGGMWQHGEPEDHKVKRGLL